MMTLKKEQGVARSELSLWLWDLEARRIRTTYSIPAVDSCFPCQGTWGPESRVPPAGWLAGWPGPLAERIWKT